MCFGLLLLALLKTAQLAMKIAKLTRSTRVLAAEMATITTVVKGKPKIECFVPVLGSAGRWNGETVRHMVRTYVRIHMYVRVNLVNKVQYMVKCLGTEFCEESLTHTHVVIAAVSLLHGDLF